MNLRFMGKNRMDGKVRRLKRWQDTVVLEGKMGPKLLLQTDTVVLSTRYRWLFKLKSIKIKYILKFRFSVMLGTFQVPSSYIWPLCWTTQRQSISIIAESPLVQNCLKITVNKLSL